MAIVVIGGHSRSVGKTSVVAGLISALPRIRLDRGEDHAIRPRHLLRQRRGLRLRDRRPFLGDFRRARPVRRVGHVAIPGRGSGAGVVGAHRTRPTRRSDARLAAAHGRRAQRDHRIEQRVEISAPGSVPDRARSGDRRFQKLRPRISGPRQRRDSARSARRPGVASSFPEAGSGPPDLPHHARRNTSRRRLWSSSASL